ncbi:MAG: metallophosphoesterase [Clostridia bacterium]|nr:metallophosphoesterase [Clostridia bacterium]
MNKKPTAKELSPKKRDARSRLICAALLLVCFFAAVLALDAYRCRSDFIIAEYEIPSEKITAPVRIAMLSDLHESSFGPGNSRLIEAVEELSPDVIVCVGDMVSRTAKEEELHISRELIESLSRIAPTYLSLGNHDEEYIRRHGIGLLELYDQAGAVILDSAFADITPAGQSIRIGGVYGYCFPYGRSEEVFNASSTGRFFKNFEDTSSFKLLLCHKPTDYYLESESDYFVDHDVDLILSGHTHGGLWRIPFLGCPYLPQQGFFPKLDHGMKRVGSTEMLIGAGLGHGSMLFRMNDPCELVSITLVPAQNG